MKQSITMTKEEQMEELRPGSLWFAPKTGKLQMVLFVSNLNSPERFRERNPSQVVFQTHNNAIVTIPTERFLAGHEFYQYHPEATAILELIEQGKFSNALELQEATEEAEEIAAQDLRANDNEPEDSQERDLPSLLNPIDIEFLTSNEDTRREPILASSEVSKLVTSITQVPVIMDVNGSMVHNGTHVTITFSAQEEEAKAILDSLFDPESALQHYGAFVLNGEIIEPDAYVGITELVNRAGRFFQANFIVLPSSPIEEEEPVQEEVVPERPKSFADLAADLKRAQEAEAKLEQVEATVPAAETEVPAPAPATSIVGTPVATNVIVGTVPTNPTV